MSVESMAAAARVGLLCALLVTASGAPAQSVVREVARPSTPFVPDYSACRTAPPDDPTAQSVFRALWPHAGDGYFRRQVASLQAKPVEGLSAFEAEAFFVALLQLSRGFARPPEGATPEQIIAAREHGLRIAERFANEPYVRCAHLAADYSLTHAGRVRERFTDRDRTAARDAQVTFLESALRDDVPTSARPGVLHAILGQRYLDRGFATLPATTRAESDLETGARHLLDAASSRLDERDVPNWKRYAFMLGKLPDAQRLAIANRLIAHVEQAWGGTAARTDAALDAYVHLLDVAGQAAFGAGQGKDAVAITSRQLDVVQRLRKRDPADPNHEVSEVFTLLLAGDAHRLDGNRRAARLAYDDAQTAFATCSANAKDMLQMQGIAKELESRQSVLR